MKDLWFCQMLLEVQKELWFEAKKFELFREKKQIQRMLLFLVTTTQVKWDLGLKMGLICQVLHLIQDLPKVLW